MGTATEIEQKLTKAFAPSALEVTDQSERHRGHAGYREGGESHFHIFMRAPAFESLSRIARHRAVHAALGPELVGRIHALALDVAP